MRARRTTDANVAGDEIKIGKREQIHTFRQ